MIDCYCDYESPDLHFAKMVRGRKQYCCYECGKLIAPGELHEYVFAVQYGGTYQPRTCADCVAIRDFVSINIPCFCWAHGNLISDCYEVITAAYSQAPDEVRGLWFGFGRLMVAARKKWGQP